ncbi:MAG: hypothetical protein QF600_06475 [Verrucomicrobiota bacterium]|nr:hypothetical protein [Verrucomicrobiota bacterium]
MATANEENPSRVGVLQTALIPLRGQAGIFSFSEEDPLKFGPRYWVQSLACTLIALTINAAAFRNDLNVFICPKNIIFGDGIAKD